MDVMERGKQWAADCGIEYRESGGENGASWKYLREAATCAVCSQEIPAGRLVWCTTGATLATHIGCQTPRRALQGCLDRGKLDRSLLGRRTETTPKSAAKFLDKLDPRSCPRFTITGGTGELASAVRGFQVRRELAAEGLTPAAPARVPKPATRKVAAPKVAAAPAPQVVEPVGSRDVPGEIPPCVAGWLERLVYGPKKEYARAWAEHVFCGAEAPADPGAEWAGKARRRMEYVLAG